MDEGFKQVWLAEATSWPDAFIVVGFFAVVGAMFIAFMYFISK